MNDIKSKSVFRRSKQRTATASSSPRSLKNRISRGQSAVEFAMISTVALFVMLVGIQYALIGQAAVAVSQGSAALARFAAASPGNVVAGGKTPGNGTVTVTSGTPLAQLLSSSLMTSTTTKVGKTLVTTPDLTVTIASTAGNGGAVTNTPTLGDQVTISLSYKATSKLALPNPFLFGLTFPTVLTASATHMYE